MLLTTKNLKSFLKFNINEISFLQRRIIHYSILSSIFMIVCSLFFYIYTEINYNSEINLLEKNISFATKTETKIDSAFIAVKNTKEIFYNYLLIPEKKNYQKYFSSLEQNFKNLEEINSPFLLHNNKKKKIKIDSLYLTNFNNYKNNPIDLNFVLTNFKTDTVSQIDTLKRGNYLKRFIDALLGKVKIQKEKQKINVIKEYKNTVDFNFFDSIPKKELAKIVKNNPNFLTEYNDTKEFLALNLELFENLDDYISNLKTNLVNFKSKSEKDKVKFNNKVRKELHFILLLLFISSLVLLVSLFILSIKTFEIEKRLLISEKINKENLILKNRIISKLTHETKVPLSLISIFSNKLENEIKNEELEEVFNSLKYTSKSLIHITSSIVQELKTQNSIDNIVKFNLMNEVKRILYSLSYITKLNDNQLIFDSNIEKLNTEVNFNLSKLQQLFYNIITNSNKYTSNGIIKLAVDFEEKETFFNFTCQVKDTGNGISEDELNQLKNLDKDSEFKQYKYDSDSLNLGIVICKEIVNNFGGDFLIKSELNKGTEVTFLLKFDKVN